MPLEPLAPSAFAFIDQVDRAYGGLMRTAGGATNLGGCLLYAGELDEAARALTCAANIAGAATLAASADPASRKQAMRDGIVDFLVTSLDEALRILKNQIRKRETVAVCVGNAPEAVEREIYERGVLPDLISPSANRTLFTAPPQSGPMLIQFVEADEAEIWITWRAAESPALCLPALDALALACLPQDAHAARRWLQLAPRYLGRLAQGAHVLRASQEFAAKFLAQVNEQIANGKIKVPVEIELGPWGQS